MVKLSEKDKKRLVELEKTHSFRELTIEFNGVSRTQFKRIFKELGIKKTRINKQKKILVNNNCFLCLKTFQADSKYKLRRYCNQICYKKARIKKNLETHQKRYFNNKCYTLKRNSLKRNIPFSLTPDDLLVQWEKQKGKCFYTKKQLSMGRIDRKNIKNSTSVDRLDNTKGYEKDNIVFCLYSVNAFKTNHSYEDFINLIDCLNLVKNKQVSFFKIDKNAYDISRNFLTDAGLDFKALEDVFIPIGKTCVIKTGIAVKIPIGWYGQVCDRSSMASKGLMVGGGVIDSLYNGEISVIMNNFSCKVDTQYSHDYGWVQGYQVKKGDKIAQLILLKCSLDVPIEIKELWDSERGNKGLGSSGK